MNAIDKIVVAPATTHRVEQDNGPAVLEGKLRWVSASMLTKGDHEAPGGCLRSWWYRYVALRPEPQRFGQGVGSKVHKELEKYFLTGEKYLSPIALAMLEHLPERDPKLLIEQRIGDFEVAGIPVCGDTDLIDPTQAPDLVEVIDHKTTSSIDKWAKTEEELGNTIQMLIYGFWAYLKFMPKTVRISHVYGQTKGATVAKKVSVALSRDEISQRFWNRVEGTALKCIEAAKQTRAEDVPANPDACEAYGGCPHRGVCEVGKSKAYEKLFGGTMGLLDRINAKPANDAVEAEKKRLKAEEAAAKAPPGFADAVERIQGAGKGFPALGGEAAKAWAGFKGEEPAAGYAGSGFLGGLTVMTTADFLQLADELLEESMKENPPSIVPPDAPPSVHPVPEEETQKRKRGRPKKAAAENTPITPDPRPTHLQWDDPKPEEKAVDLGYTEDSNPPGLYKLSIFADCIPSTPHEPLEPYIDRLCKQLCEAHGCLDVRCGEERGPIGFGKWKGALAALAREAPPERGVYTVDTRSEIAFEVVSALRTMDGTFFVRSVR